MRGRPRSLPQGPYPNKIAEFRHRAQMSQEDVADVLGVTASAVGKLERGWRRLRLDQLDKLATAFNCGGGDLLPGGDHISDRERRLLELYRQLPKSQQDALLGLGSALAEPPLDFLPPRDERPGKKKA